MLRSVYSGGCGDMQKLGVRTLAPNRSTDNCAHNTARCTVPQNLTTWIGDTPNGTASGCLYKPFGGDSSGPVASKCACYSAESEVGRYRTRQLTGRMSDIWLAEKVTSGTKLR